MASELAVDQHASVCADRRNTLSGQRRKLAMPNGHGNNWVRVCAAIDGFRIRFGRWPKRVRLMPIAFVDLASDTLTPLGFALVSSYVELVPEEDAEMVAEDDSGAVYSYGHDGFPKGECDPPTRDWFGEAILRPDLVG
jgi:hypothetical protein